MQTSALINKFTTYFSADSLDGGFMDHPLESNSRLTNKFRKFKRFIKRSKYLPFIIVGIVFAGILFFTVQSFMDNSSSVASFGSEDSRVEIKKPRASQSVQRLFLFPLKDSSGKEVSKLKLTLQRAELRNEIIVKGQRARSVKGRTFLIVNLKIENDFEKSLQINSRDYFRLIVNNSNEKLAPEIHNDPVEVQAISTKYTRVGFPIDEDYKSLSLQVGEITGKKEILKLNLR